MASRKKSGSWFSRFSQFASRLTGTPIAFGFAVLIILIWIVSGPLFGYSDTWQLIINTSTTIITFLMVFLIQSTQNRDSEALQIKIDELIRAISGADNSLINLEEMEPEELDRIRNRFIKLAAQASDQLKERQDESNPAA
jgi:low affinity Fe/Cu permease